MTTSVDIHGMQLAQQDFQQALDQMNSIYSAMDEERDTLTANWRGMAASAFGQALDAWLDDVYQIRQELVVMTEALAAHTGIYSDANETSQQVATAFQQRQGQGLAGLETLPDTTGHPGTVFYRSERPPVKSERVEAPLPLEPSTPPQLVKRVEAPPLPVEPSTPYLQGVEALPLPLGATTPYLQGVEAPLLAAQPDHVVARQVSELPAQPDHVVARQVSQP